MRVALGGNALLALVAAVSVREYGYHLPVYLDEFVFRWNRRRAPMAGFQTLLGLGTHREPTTYEEILGRPAASNGPRSRGRKTGLTRSAEA